LLIESEAGYKALLLTADSPVLGRRWNETRNAFHLPAHLDIPVFGKAAILTGMRSEEFFASLNGENKFCWLRKRS
jgi:(S)-2-hydroxy-acid oxidase